LDSSWFHCFSSIAFWCFLYLSTIPMSKIGHWSLMDLAIRLRRFSNLDVLKIACSIGLFVSSKLSPCLRAVLIDKFKGWGCPDLRLCCCNRPLGAGMCRF
jgi:hypothetical protein